MEIAIDPITDARIADAAAFCAARLLASGPRYPWLHAASLEATTAAVEHLLRDTSDGAMPLGLIAHQRGAVRAILAGAVVRREPDSAAALWNPVHEAFVREATCVAEGPEMAVECFPPLLERWRQIAAAHGAEYVTVSQPTARWQEAALLRRLGLRPYIAAGAQLCTGWTPLAGRATAGLSVRPATPDDAATLTDLTLELRNFHRALPGSAWGRMLAHEVSRETVHAHIVELLHQDSWHFVLADHATSPSGVPRLAGFFLGNIWSEGRLTLPPCGGHLKYASVAADLRGCGVGQRLCDALMAWFVERGVPFVTVGFDPSNPIAPHFWERMGFAPYRELLVYTGSRS